MSYIAAVFGEVLHYCYSIGAGNYITAILLFTFVTKILLLPISLWTQKNSVKMVKMKPELNMLQVKFFGDKDKIADETAAIYKDNKYSPFSGIIPLLIQIIFLLGIIEVVKYPEYARLSNADMTVSGVGFFVYPYLVGGVYWLVPLFTGASALVLSLVQNRINPLQAEASGREKFGTMAFSVGISLALGAFVPLGVGWYWICSNLLTIVQQLFLNRIIRPSNYIDHEMLEESKRQLSELQSIGSTKKKFARNPYAAREREDYKRFFSVVNKHIVFYSENNGFYKYFEKTIDYLLQHSNLTIHYVTSDPTDHIFEKANENPRIRGYYIGEKRLITLMMKMDADMVVMTMSDLENYHIKRSYVRKNIEYVYMFHYPLSTHMVLHTGALDHYDTIFCVGEFQIGEIRRQEELYHLKKKELVVCGYGQLEKLQEAYDVGNREHRIRKRILIAPSWQEDNLLDSCIDDLLKNLLGHSFDVIVRPHPEYVKRYPGRMTAIVERYKDYARTDLSFELDFTTNTSIFDSDVVITDWSGTAYEFSFVTGKPSVFIDTPMKVNNPEYGILGIEPLELSLRSQIGIQIAPDALQHVYDDVLLLLDRQEDYRKRILELRNVYIANYGCSGEVGGKYLINSLKAKDKKRGAGE